ncbi:MAG: CapA family protein [Cytophagaceae bacterium]|nr:CapA family protein [Cytophagaceae bacterium]MDW8456366.1 CapA family protein [Cytophagaceae bacterium]
MQVLLIYCALLIINFSFGQIKKDTLSIIGVGDIMMGSNYPSGYLPPDDGRYLLSPVKDILRDADVTFGNLEGTFLNSGGQMKNCSNPNVCYAFRQPEHYVNYLVEAGFDVMSIANNHTGDFGEEGRATTVKTLEKAGLKYAGLVSCPYTIFETGGVKYGMCAFAPNPGTVSINDLANARKIVSKLDSICDVVIVSFHGGAEGSRYVHVPKTTEMFYGENRGDVYRFSHAVIDAGADIVFGHGPHVTRAVEYYKGRFIAYSLGNFCTYGRFNLQGVNGIAPIMKVYVNKRGEFLYAKVISIKQPGQGGPVIDDKQTVYQSIIQLTKTDFPDTQLTFPGNGIIAPK